MEDVIFKIKDLIDEKRFEVRVYRRSFLHAKCYIFGNYESSEAVGIIGSSNFTRNGLTTNAELNALESDHRVITFQPRSPDQEIGHLSWFDEMWNDEKTESWEGQFVELLRTSPNGDLLHSPRNIYLRTLYELYKEEINLDKEEIIHPKSKTLHEFQEKNVKNILRILCNNGVAMLADSVGLGKTVSAVGVIKQYANQRVIVIAPKSLKGMWEQELAQEGLHNVHVASLQNRQEIIDKSEIDKHAPVNLFIIDESHNLRSSSGTRYEQLSDWIANPLNEEAHVLLVTATPINNSLTDLTNQILLGARGDQDIFTVTVKSYDGQIVNRSFYEAIDNIRKRIKQNIDKGEDVLEDIYADARVTLEPIIRNFVVRNTRESIGDITNEKGEVVSFPEIKIENKKYPPVKNNLGVSEEYKKILKYPVDILAETMDKLLHPLRQLETLNDSDGTLDSGEKTLVYNIYQLILSLSLVPYRWSMYDFRLYGKTKEELKKIRFRSSEQQKINMQLGLYGIIRTLFLKRLESSPKALEVSLERYLFRLQIFEQALVNENIIINLSDIEDIVDEYEADDGNQVIFDDSKLFELARRNPQEVDDNFNKDVLLEDIQLEKRLIAEIISLVRSLKESDQKIVDLKNRLLKSYKNNPNKKILIFTFFADTVDYIQNELEIDPKMSKIFEKTGFVSGRDQRSAIHSAKRFSPIAQDSMDIINDDGELTYLFATDVLSEGQNLQDCGELINYDLHWNPVRMVQRNGRINRLGSLFKEVLVENYIPSDDLEEFLGLMQKINRKIELIKHAIGTDSSIFGEKTNPRSYTNLYSEDNETATKEYGVLESKLDAFSEDKFLYDLKKFYETADNEEIRHMERIPFKSWGIIPGGLEKPNDVVVFSRIHSEDGSCKEIFFGNDSDATGIDMIPTALALNMIRSEIKDKQRDTIYIDKEKQFKEVGERGPQIARNITVDQSLTPSKERVLGESSTHKWTAEDKDKLRATLSTRNILLGRRISRLVRSITQALNNNEPTEEYYAVLRKMLIEPTEQPKITQIDELLGYTDQFKK
jgi:superfamily II DNA/RNA helicase